MLVLRKCYLFFFFFSLLHNLSSLNEATLEKGIFEGPDTIFTETKRKKSSTALKTEHLTLISQEIAAIKGSILVEINKVRRIAMELSDISIEKQSSRIHTTRKSFEEKRARWYIIRKCIYTLLCWREHTD
ncbi:hypothetical protein L2E82_40445 [Cichorium intybus]|uniref:Uncharacterized protein n=1 Tax=Cichorium intybus TaxID=13427 RepID=A0ACB9ALN6_CICIN|nr:hypothetical protein L2E82_40445 [Cichorium intybus]